MGSAPWMDGFKNNAPARAALCAAGRECGEVAEWSTNSPGANWDSRKAGPERKRGVSIRDDANNAPARAALCAAGRECGEVAEWSTNSPGANWDSRKAGPERKRGVSIRDDANNAPARAALCAAGRECGEVAEWSTNSPGANWDSRKAGPERKRGVSIRDDANNAPARAALCAAGRECGEVAEWSNAPDSKSGLRLCRNVGSNPTLSANLDSCKYVGSTNRQEPICTAEPPAGRGAGRAECIPPSPRVSPARGRAAPCAFSES